MTVDLQSTPLPLRTNSPKVAMVGGFELPTSWLTANWLSRGNATFIRRLGYDPVTPVFSTLW